jgi:hypothetical protein
MPLFSRRRTLLAKIEGTYGVDPVPTGGANAILIVDPQVTPQEAQLVDRDVVRDYLGNVEQLPAAINAAVSFGVEVAGAGTAGTVPPYGPLLRACGMSELALGTAHSGTATAGSTTTITLAAAASASNNAYRGMTIRATGGAGVGQQAVIASYDGTTKVAVLTETQAVAFGATTTYTIDAQVVYLPVSTGFESVTQFFNVDGVNHRLFGARGSVALEFAARQRPLFRFTFRGLYQPVLDAALPTTVLTAFQVPRAVNNTNTPLARLHGIATPALVLERLSVDLANNVVFRSLVGAESVLITDRKPKGELSIEANTVAAKDWWQTARDATLGGLSLTHGTVAGNIVGIHGPDVQIVPPGYADSDGITMMTAQLNFLPNLGNDDLVIRVQ